MKNCYKCNESKPLSDFYKGHARCKRCVCERVSLLRAAKLNDPDWVAKERERCRKKTARARAEGKLKPPTNEVRKRWAQRNREKRRAQGAVSHAIRRGKILKPSACSDCATATPRLEAHHPDYTKPLEIQWLCTKCHGKTRHKSGPIAQLI